MTKENLPITQSTDLCELLRQEFPTSEGVTPHNAFDFIHEFGSVSGALLYATLFVPKFIFVNDSVLLDSMDPDLPQRFIEARQAWEGNLEDLEASFNWREIPYIFSDTDTNERACTTLARLISDAWRAHLYLLFPHRKFVVQILSADEAGGSIGVGFRERRE